MLPLSELDCKLDMWMSADELYDRENNECNSIESMQTRIEALKGRLPVIAMGIIRERKTAVYYSRILAKIVHLRPDQHNKLHFLQMAPPLLWVTYMYPNTKVECFDNNDRELWREVKKLLLKLTLSAGTYSPQKLEDIKAIEYLIANGNTTINK